MKRSVLIMLAGLILTALVTIGHSAKIANTRKPTPTPTKTPTPMAAPAAENFKEIKPGEKYIYQLSDFSYQSLVISQQGGQLRLTVNPANRGQKPVTVELDPQNMPRYPQRWRLRQGYWLRFSVKTEGEKIFFSYQGLVTPNTGPNKTWPKPRA